MGERLVDLYRQNVHLPRQDLRCKVPTDQLGTDRELFVQLSDDDLWLDAKLPDVLFYLAKNKHLRIPASWHHDMTAYIEYVRKQVFRLQWPNMSSYASDNHD